MTSLSPNRLLEEINRRQGLALVLAERYAGGEQGAYAVLDPRGERLVLKWSIGAAPHARFRRAARVAERLSRLGYPTPRYLYSGRTLGASYMIQTELPGAPMQRLSAEQLPALLALNQLQAGQARASRPVWPHLVVDTVLHGGDGYCLLGTMRAHSSQTNQLLSTLQAVVAANAGGHFTTNDVVHFDFSLANILADSGQISGVIDWEGACAGDRGFDLATLLFYTYDQAETRATLWRAAVELSGPAAMRVYLAHMILRQVEWSIRFHDQVAVSHWLRRAEGILRAYILL